MSRAYATSQRISIHTRFLEEIINSNNEEIIK